MIIPIIEKPDSNPSPVDTAVGVVLVVILFGVIAMSLWQLRWYWSKSEDVKYSSWRERLHIPPWLFPSAERVTPRAAASLNRHSDMSDSSLTPIFLRTPRPQRTDLSTHTLAALAAGPITTIGNPHWQATVPGLQRLTSPKLAYLAGTQEATYNPPSFPVYHSALRPKLSYGSIGSTTSRTTTTTTATTATTLGRSPKNSPPILQTTIYGGHGLHGLGIQGLRVNSSFEAATGIGMGSNYKAPPRPHPHPHSNSHSNSHLDPPLPLPTPPPCRGPSPPWSTTPLAQAQAQARLLTPEPRSRQRPRPAEMDADTEPARIRPAQLATRRHRSSSTAVSDTPLEAVELDGEGRRMEKRARVEKYAGRSSPNAETMGCGGTTLRRRQSVDGDPFKTPELRVVNI